MEPTQQQKICPITGFPVTRVTRWIDRQEGSYRYNFKKIGDSIVYVANSGNLKHFSVEKYYRALDAFCKEALVRFPIIEIRDIKNLKGKPSSAEISRQKEYFLRNQERFTGLLMCNVPFWMRALILAGLKRYPVSMEFLVCRTPEEALKKAKRILENKPVERDGQDTLDFRDLQFNPRWQYHNPQKKVTYENGVIPGKVFYSKIQGDYISYEDFCNISPFFEQVFKDGMLTDSHYVRIVDYSGVKKSSIRLRNAYAKLQLRLNTAYNCKAKVTYICGANLFIRTALKLYTRLVNQHFVFLDSVDQAFEAINSRISRENNEKIIHVTQRDVEEINNLCGMLVWDEEEAQKGGNLKVSEDNSLYELYETISLVQNDLIALRQREILQAKRLKTALKQAESANTVKSQFLANMSHELLTPLNGVTGNLEMAMDTGLSIEQREYIEAAKSSADKLQRLVGNIFDFMTFDEDENTPDNKPFDLKRLMDGISNTLKPRADEKHLYYICRIDQNVPCHLYGDPGCLSKILKHIISNAVKFTEKGSVSIHLSKQNESADSVHILFEITDTGIGIPQGMQDCLFEMFTQADASTTRAYEGAGIGLSICKKLMDHLGGEIGFDSKQGKGSHFWFRLEFGKRRRLNKLNVPDENTMDPEGIKKKLKILVVDDNAMNRKVATMMLGKMGHETFVAENGRIAVDLFEPDRYDLIFMDLQMPVLGGEDAVRQIRRIETRSGRHTPIIALTANTIKGSRERCLAAGMDEFMSKPLRKESLEKKISRFY